jgi:hypothetical protein
MLCVPSQKGGVIDRLQPHKYTVPDRSAVKTDGLLSVPAWAPSQKGCRSERPQEHQKYDFAASTSTACGRKSAGKPSPDIPESSLIDFGTA